MGENFTFVVHAFILQAINMERMLGISKGAGSYSGQGRGESRERGIQGAVGESRAAAVNRAEMAFCHVQLL